MRIFGALIILAGIVTALMGGLRGIANGIDVAVAGCIVYGLGAIEAAVRASSTAQVAALQAGFENLKKQLTPSQPSITEPTATERPHIARTSAAPWAEVGKCPKCGRRRRQDEPVCEGCGSRQPAEFSR